MSEYTPTTEDMQDCFCSEHARHENEGGAWITPKQHERFHAQFDRWLQAERARIWNEGFGAGWENAWNTKSPNYNPYRGEA